jgi:hypothetical protein
MKEYDQFMQQVKGRGKSKAPKETFANDFLDPKAAYMRGGQDPVTGKALPHINPDAPRGRKPDVVDRFAMSVARMQPKIAKLNEMQERADKIGDMMNRRKITPAEREANLERMINKFMQEGLSPQTARRLAMERMQD